MARKKKKKLIQSRVVWECRRGTLVYCIEKMKSGERGTRGKDGKNTRRRTGSRSVYKRREPARWNLSL